MWKRMKKRVICILLVCTLLITHTVWAEEEKKDSVAGDNLTFLLPFLDVLVEDAEGRWQKLQYIDPVDEMVDHVKNEDKAFWEKNTYGFLNDAKKGYDSISIQGMQMSDIVDMTLKKEVFEAVWKGGLNKYFAEKETDAINKVLNKITDIEDSIGELSAFKKEILEDEDIKKVLDSESVKKAFKGYEIVTKGIINGVGLYDILSSDDPDKALQTTLWFSKLVVGAVEDATKNQKGLLSVKLANGVLDFSNGNWANLMRTQEYKEFVEEHREDFNKAFLEASVDGIIECLDGSGEQWKQLGKAIIDTLTKKDDGLTFVDRLLGKTKPTSQVNVYKPNIYLYSESPLNASVTFKQQEYLTVSIPDYSLGWNAKVHGDGQLTCQDHTYDFLFYESLASKALAVTEAGWIIEAKTREEQLRQVLQLYKFNEKETTDFMEFWMEMLEENVDYVMYPQDTEAVDKQMPITIIPSPDKITRIWFAFEVYEEQSIEEPMVEEIQREGFTIVEWGGFFLD